MSDFEDFDDEDDDFTIPDIDPSLGMMSNNFLVCLLVVMYRSLV